MKKLIQEKTQFLNDMLDGLKYTNPNIDVIAETVVVRKHKKTSGVALVSGGGSGHEPAHAGYVAEGMLDAAVCGEVFTSPTPDKVLEAIKAVDNGDGILLIVKNYAGDVMNFEMAQDMAAMEGINVEMVVVRDDIAIDDVAKRRGVAGTVWVHKYAGYLAEQGTHLKALKTKIEQFLEGVRSIGMAIIPPAVPTTGKYGFDIGEDEMEIGIGIHGERGLERTQIEPIAQIVQRLTTKLEQEVDSDALIVMINGMGGTPLSELNIVTKYVAQQLEKEGKVVKGWFVGDYMTSLDMQGFSLTFVPYDDHVLAALNAPTTSRNFNS
ncbi:dihydroxyacetone kinase subunit DhaK [Staphylococcus coagulans]|uniref:dihydroxyacetone kinase subunit DhaK n=1 Tax=Staphylococcus coagulans TaxID=74706 RepID=UPI001BED04AB|nr:dihydroxyacetone kinase subunit DhaK [Staphylococcus coagulans]MBT2814347.1 dihydroxyacetone kinase subunit DhaK [Staphylococcus coagulans]MBT2816736.1 dihydroxyacetone kinase subunit DhaK [Staphylococcus coagulans]MBT2837374.1 dihydroxyacetone kinase subunit DhaK [Staphylococcus coagulans]MBT2841833.1 dihydroxyacetone kinase subunit DhaK [Staphylococcus coagulans]MBT2848642.1 dihydroxyacetone kinase subunit DhaK [Staphylococcus coagulans]